MELLLEQPKQKSPRNAEYSKIRHEIEDKRKLSNDTNNFCATTPLN
jgi:hypothetical protein